MSSNFGMKGYMKGALILTIAAILVKVLSAIYRVPFQNLVGDQGFYIYQQVYPFISFFVVWTSGGFAVAISKMLADLDISQDTKLQKHFVASTIFKYLSLLSLVFFVFLFFGAEWLANLMGDGNLAILIKSGSFVALFMPMLALMKGIFQSRGEMAPVAYAQVFEQAIRVSLILIGTFIIMKTSQSLYMAGNMAVLGTVFGEIAGVLLLYNILKRKLPRREVQKIKLKKWPIIKEVTLLSISVSMSSLLILTMQLVDSFTIYSLMVSHGMEETVAQVQKGIYDRGQPLVQLGIVIASSLSLAVVPLVAHHMKKSGGRSATPFIQLTYRSSLMFGVAASLGLVIVMPYVNTMLFKTDDLSHVLMVIALQIIPLSIILTLTAILQGMGKLKMPAIIILGSLVVKGIGNVILVPHLNVLGASIASDLSLYLCALLLIVYLKKLTSIHLAQIGFYIKLFTACLTMTVVVFVVERILQLFDVLIDSTRVEALLFGMCLIGIGAFVFLTVVGKTRLLAEKEWFLIPFGRRMAVYQLWLNKRK
ncbi:putative polysaccharide biosynthesis protein [Ureibacillus acetophenoni]|uniref:PST family polysaccharide transporter n=1 Tax=Ureibacillus acetophenoni TaxID=614649 RepID=A0A285USV6_9BACL|nr:polysaccharide biosynthesis protein [Ureibacillus acetophenoni]SOC44757.1 PST family polysaccharide transporter [Ureibacillus acetophenoni]